MPTHTIRRDVLGVAGVSTSGSGWLALWATGHWLHAMHIVLEVSCPTVNSAGLAWSGDRRIEIKYSSVKVFSNANGIAKLIKYG